MELKTKTMVQYCIDTQYVPETIRNIPESVKIENISFEAGVMTRKIRRTVPNSLSKLGITGMREAQKTMSYSVRLSGLSHKDYLKVVRELGKAISIDEDKFRVNRIELEFNGATAVFTRITKQIKPDITDLRKKVKVLGLSSSDGNVKDLLLAVSANKYSCKMKRVFTTEVVCSQERPLTKSTKIKGAVGVNVPKKKRGRPRKSQ